MHDLIKKYQQGGGLINDVPIVQPDYNFLNYSLSKVNQEYEQGVSNVRNMYNSILNSPLSNSENIEKRQQYLQNAKQSLQKVAKSDLSMPQNQQAAAEIFKPFYEDNDIVHDMSLTKQISSEIQRGYAARDSQDKDIRSSYNDESVKNLQGVLQDLSEAKRGDGSIQQVRAKSWVPFINQNDYLSKCATTDGLTYSYSKSDGRGHIYKFTNGVAAEQNFNNWASSKIGADFDSQYKVLAENQVRDGVNHLRSIGYSKEEALNLIGKQQVEGYLGEKQQYINHRNNELDGLSAKRNLLLEKINKQGGGLPEDKAKFNDLNYQMNAINDDALNHQKELDRYDDNWKNVHIKNPSLLSSEFIKLRTLNNWVKGYASGTYEESVETDQGYWNQKNYDLSISKFGLEKDKFKEEKDQHSFENQIATAKLSIEYKRAGINFATGKPIDPLDGSYVSGKSPDKFENMPVSRIVEENKNQINREIVSTLYDKRGNGLSSFLQLTGVLDKTELPVFNTYMDAIESGEKRIQDNNVKAIFQKLANKGIIKVDNNATDQSEIAKTVRVQLLNHIQNHGKDITDNYLTSEQDNNFKNLALGLRKKLEYKTAVEKDEQDKLSEILAKDKNNDFKEVTVTENGKKPRILTNEDLEPQIKQLHLVDSKGHEIDSKKAAKAYKDGTLEIESNGLITAFTLDGTQYHRFGLDGKDQDFYYKYGDPKDLSKKINDIYSKVYTNGEEIQKETGKQGNDNALDWNNPSVPVLVKESFKTSNNVGMYDQNGRELTDPDIKKYIESITSGKNPEELYKIFSSPSVNAIGKDLNMTLTVYLKDDAEDESKSVKALKDENISEINIRLNPGSSDPFIKDLIAQHGYRTSVDIFPQLKKGIPVESSAFEESLGIYYQLIPNNANSDADGYKLYMKGSSLDPKTGKIISNSFQQFLPPGVNQTKVFEGIENYYMDNNRQKHANNKSYMQKQTLIPLTEFK